MKLPDFPTSAISYQPNLAAFVTEHKLHNIVETGLGISTIYLLRAMDEMDAGSLITIDPNPWFKSPIEHPRLTWMQQKASTALKSIAGPLDLFLHDGNHNCYAQTLEFHYAWSRLRIGGWLVSDDWTWGSHDAWRKFLKHHKLEDHNMDSLRMVQKTTDSPATSFDECLVLAQRAEREWFASGGKNSDCFVD